MLDSAIIDLAAYYDVDVQPLEDAQLRTQRNLAQFRESLLQELDSTGGVPNSLDVVLFGSFAREEATSGSDCDYLVLLNGTPAAPDVQRTVRAVEMTRKFMQLTEPGKTGTFGDIVSGSELLTRIGLEADTNANTTRRILLLAESVSALDASVTLGIKTGILDRYLGDYAPEANRQKPVRVPHFLLNDLIRYWRTMAVDFGAKQWRSVEPDWYLRFSKLLITRKILFAGTLALLLTTEKALAPIYSAPSRDSAAVYHRLQSHLMSGLRVSPLTRLIRLAPDLQPTPQEAMARLLGAYAGFIALLDDPVRRTLLASGRREGSGGSQNVRQEADDLANIIHEALLTIFHDDPLLNRAVRTFSLF